MQLICDQQLHSFTSWLNLLQFAHYIKWTFFTIFVDVHVYIMHGYNVTTSHVVQHQPCIFNTCTCALCTWFTLICVSVCMCVSGLYAVCRSCKWHQGSHPMIMLHNTLTSADPIALLSPPCLFVHLLLYLRHSFRTYKPVVFFNRWFCETPDCVQWQLETIIFYNICAIFLRLQLCLCSSHKKKYPIFWKINTSDLWKIQKISSRNWHTVCPCSFCERQVIFY